MFHCDKQMFCWLIELSNVSQRLTNVSSTNKRPDSQSNVSSISLSMIMNANVTKLYQLFLTGKGVPSFGDQSSERIAKFVLIKRFIIEKKQ